MTNAYNESNARVNSDNANKTFRYTLLDKDFNIKAKGMCKDVIFRYDSCYDYNIITFTDVETGKRSSICQFYIELHQVD